MNRTPREMDCACRESPRLKPIARPPIILTRYYFLGKKMATVSVTSKGQVTIPKKIRQALGITPGSKVEFDLESGGARLKVVRVRSLSRIEEGPGILSYKARVSRLRRCTAASP